jgi:uncharacterized membrane protein SpoIIM required for sporulation
MVLESLIHPKIAEKRPFDMFVLGIVYTSIAAILALWIFPSSPSLPMIFLTTMAALPVMIDVLKKEEKEAEEELKKYLLIGPHFDVFIMHLALFLGFVVAFTAWFAFLPNESSQTLFNAQIETIRAINSGPTGAFIEDQFTSSIVVNNLKVLMFCIIFSFLYGAGAIFILCWNASVISTAVGTLIRENLGAITGLADYFKVVPLSFARYFIHGLPEIMAYFCGGIAGGIISAAVVRHDLGSENFLRILLDSVDLIIIAFFLLVFSALIEVQISPLVGV